MILLVGNRAVLASDSICFRNPPIVSSIDHYTLSDGLASNNLNNVFLDSKGRMWVNPDVTSARQFRLSFFQFDGEQSQFYDLQPPWSSENDLSPVWYVLGESPDGYLYWADIENSIVFYWHPDTNVQHYLRVSPGQRLLNMASDAQGEIYLLLLDNAYDTDSGAKKYIVTRFSQDLGEEVASIPLDFIEDIVPPEAGNSTYPFVVDKSAAWFFHQRKGIVTLNLQNTTYKYLPWSEFDNMPPVLKTYFDFPLLSEEERDIPRQFEWKLIDFNEQEMLVYLGMQNGFFRIDRQTFQIYPEIRLNQRFIKGPDAGDLKLNQKVPYERFGGFMARVYFSRDQLNNLFIASGYYEPWNTITIRDSLEAILVDPEGNWIDYSHVMREMYDLSETKFSRPGTFYSNNFRYQLGSTVLEDGLLMLDLQPDLGILNHPKQRYYEFSGMTMLDRNTLLVNSNHQVLRLMNWRDTVAQYDRLTQWWHLAARTGSSIVNQGERIWMSVVYYMEPRTGLQWYEPATNETGYIPTKVPFEKFFFLNDNQVVLFEDRWDLPEIGAIHLLDLKSRTTQPLLYRGEPLSIGEKVNDLYFSSDRLLWVAAQNGLWKIDFSNSLVENFNQSEVIGNQNILCISPARDGKLWLGTVRSGIIKFDPISGDTQQITVAQGLSHNTVVGILVDEAENRWVSTLDGITVLNTQGKVLFELKKKDGLLGNWFYPNASFKSSDGLMFFGGAGGLSILKPDYVFASVSQRQPYRVILTGLEFYNHEKDQTVVRQGTFNQQEPLFIAANHRYLNLDFAITNYAGLDEHTYAYRLMPDPYTEQETEEIPWIDLGSESQLNLNNLPPGDFIIEIIGRDHFSKEGVIPLQIPVRVDNFFYRKWWFYVLSALPFLLGTFLYIRRIKGDKHRLEREVVLRTEQLHRDGEVIKEQADRLRELDKDKTRFFTNISHEFRTPLTVILGMAEQLRNQVKEKDIIRRNANQLLRLINQILELGKLQTGTMSASYIQGDIITFLKYYIESFHSLAEQKNIELEFESTENPLVLDYDPEKLNHILSNLLTNAIKFTPEGGKVRILVEAHRNISPPIYQFSVIDSGIGITQDKLTNIFDRFFQTEDKESQGKGGVGVGLSMVHELVKLLKGNISVQSLPGRGTMIKVMLPYTTVAQSEPNRQEEFSIEALKSGSTEKNSLTPGDSGKNDLSTLLIVEDNRDVTEYLIDRLKDEYHLLIAADGQEGLEIALEKVPDIIISDVMMPRLDGLQMCKEIKHDERTSHIPIILLTAKADIESKLAGLECGADVYLEKPFHKKELRLQLRNLSQTRQRLRERYINIENLEETPDKSVQKEDAFIFRLREIIIESMHEQNLGVPELCKKVGMSRTQLHNKIKALTGHSTSHFIKKVRIRQATRLLRTSEMNISQVAFEVGVDSLPYFTKIFTKETGLSPSKFRENASLEQ
jgi:signal transduction histidine kinase/DNA-binding response OmpR family regulator